DRRVADDVDAGLRRPGPDPLDRGGDLRRRGGDALLQLVDAVADIAVAARRAEGRQRGAVLEDRAEADVVAADAEGDDGRVGGQRVELRRVGSRGDVLRARHVAGVGPAAADVGEL